MQEGSAAAAGPAGGANERGKGGVTDQETSAPSHPADLSGPPYNESSPPHPLRKDLPMRSAVVIEAVRTPVGKAHPEKGCFRDVRADDLSADLLSALLQRTGLPPAAVEDIQWGCVKQQAEQGFN